MVAATRWLTEPALAPFLAAAATLAAAGALLVGGDRVVESRIAVLAAPRARPRERFRALLRWLGGRFPRRWAGSPTDRLATAGWTLGVEELLGVRVLCAGSAMVLLVVMPGPATALAPLGALGGWLAPSLMLGRAARRRADAAAAELPQLLDLLAAGSTAGLSGFLALRRAVDGVGEPLAGELRAAVRAADLGARWRDELARVADRLDLRDLQRAVVAMARTENLGSPLAETLREQAEELRERRRAAMTEAARKAPVKMLFPLVFMILPAFLLLTVVPVLLATLRSIR